jgi:16S rRNA (uracil1498-N3)-methyltransferase
MVQRITIEASQLQGQSISLRSDQVHYLTRVLRLKAGDRFIAQTGLGQQWLAALSDGGAFPGNRTAEAVVLEAMAVIPIAAPPLRLIAALPKGNGFDQVVRQSTELGATHIYPVLSDRTLLKPSDHKLTRWRRIAQEAAEQSERPDVPEIFEPVGLQQCFDAITSQSIASQSIASKPIPLQSQDRLSLRYFCAARPVESGTSEMVKNPAETGVEGTDGPKVSRDAHSYIYSGVEKRAQKLAELGKSPHLLACLLVHQAEQPLLSAADITVAIGPEGGWTPAEISVAISYEYTIVTLGSPILRAITASITALSLVTGARNLLI